VRSHILLCVLAYYGEWHPMPNPIFGSCDGLEPGFQGL
jgi:hypothetical protein